MQKSTGIAKVSPISSGYGSEFSSGSITSAVGTRGARVFKTRPYSNKSSTLQWARESNGVKIRRKSEKIRREEDGKKGMAKAVLPAKLATFLGIFSLITAVLVWASRLRLITSSNMKALMHI